MNVTNIYLSKHEDVKELAERIGTDIGSLELLTTENKKNVVVAINELKSIMSSVENNLGDYSTKQELTQAITDLINGADADSDTLKELADKITTLAQTDNGLVSASSEQIFDSVQKEIARKNIDAVSTTDLNTAVDTLNNTHAKRSELEQAKTELSDSIEAKSSQLLGVITAEEATRKAEDEAIRGELTLTNGKIQEAIDAIPEVDLTPFATKVELTRAIIDLINGADVDSDTLKELADKITALAQTDKGLVNVTVAQEFTVEQKTQARSNIDAVSTNELEAQKEDLLEDIVATVKPLATKVDLEAKAEKAPEGDEYALVSSLPSLVAPYATKVDLTQAIADLINEAEADTDADTLKELADKITALAQTDKGLVSALEAQEFSESQKQQARDNIDVASKSDIPDISGLVTKAESDANYHNKAVTYTRTEMDGRYSQIINTYTKDESDSNFAPKALTYLKTESDGRYPLATKVYTKLESDGKYALKSASYTKDESDARYYDTTQANARFALKTDSYTKADGDARYEYVGIAYTKAQSDAKYPLKTASYTKAESDTNYHNKSVTYTRTEMDTRYPLKTASYTKAESDGRYYGKSEVYTQAQTYSTTQADFIFALKIDTYTKTDSDDRYHQKRVTYTRTEMDGRYYTKTTADSTFAKVWTGTLTQYNAITTKDDNTIYIVT